MGGRSLAVLVAWLLLASQASAHDSLAPAGAAHDWLPPEEWVVSRWVPFDEQQLKVELGLRGRDLEAYLYDDHHTLAALASRRGLPVEDLVSRLLAPWGPTLAPERLATLRDRTRRILTQGHLAQHMFFHVFHDAGLYWSAERLFGVAPEQFSALRRRGWTGLAIARSHGLDQETVTVRAVEILVGERDRAIGSGEAWPAQVDRILARQSAALACWLQGPAPARDPTNPYGKASLQHGDHRADWPRTRAQRRADEARTERVRANLKRGCWKRPPVWNASAGHGDRTAAARHPGSIEPLLAGHCSLPPGTRS